ncbi:MAG: 2TM domain-containing protein [Acidimicrobiales bacterium]
MPRYGRRRFDETDDFVVDERDAARRRVRARRDLSSKIVGFIFISAVVVVIWALSGGGYFWPGWIIGIVGAMLLLQVWRHLGRRPLTEEDVDAEVRRHRDRWTGCPRNTGTTGGEGTYVTSAHEAGRDSGGARTHVVGSARSPLPGEHERPFEGEGRAHRGDPFRG